MLNQTNLKQLQAKSFVWQESVDIVLGVVSSNIVSLFMLIGTITIAIVPAIFTGFAVFSLTVALWGYWLSFTAGVVFAFGLEAVGMTTSNVALHLYRAWRTGKGLLEEFLIASGLMTVYVVTVVLVILFVDELPPTLKAIGISSPFLAVILYVSRGLYLDHKQAETKERIEADESRIEKRDRRIETSDSRLAHQQAMEILRLELEHKERVVTSGTYSEPSGQTPEVTPKALTVNARVKDYLDSVQNPKDALLTEIMLQTKVSQTTASVHRARYLSQLNGKG